MVATKKFSQFVVGNYNKVGDITVGLRGGVNEQFNFPGIGIQDASGNFLYQYASGGAASVNYLLINSSVSTAPPILTVGGTDTNISLNLEPKGGGNLIFDGLNWPVADGPAGYVIGTNGSAQLSFMAPGSFPVAPGPLNTILISNGSAWTHSTATYLPTLTANLVLYASAANTLGQIAGTNGGILTTGATGVPGWLANPGSTGNMLQSVSGNAPSFSTATYPSVATSTGTILRADGTNWVHSTATFADTYAASALLYSNGANTITGLATANGATLVTSASGVPSWLANPAATGLIYTSVNGQPPAWSTSTFPLTAGPTNTIIISNGTNWITSTPTYLNALVANELLYASATNVLGQITLTDSAVLVSNASGVPAWSGTMTDGQLIIGATSGTPTAATITAGAGITVTNGSNTITIASSGSGFSWNDITGTSATMAVENGYVSDNSGLVTLTLPATAAFGATIAVQGKGSGGWKIAQPSGVTIHFGNADTSTGVSGSLASTNRYDSLFLVCITANTDWAVLSGVQGTITVV